MQIYDSSAGVRPGYDEDNVVGGECGGIVESYPAETACAECNHVLAN